MKRLIVFTAFILIFTANAFDTRAQTTEKTIEIKIYLIDRFTAGWAPTARDLFAVKRKISATEPLRAAIRSLLDGPTDDELNNLKLYPAIEHIDLISVRPKGKTVWVNIAAWDINLIDPPDVRLFRHAVVKTLRQFKPVRKVEICLDGIANFDRLRRRTPIRKCSLY